MHQVWGPAVVGVCFLITLTVYFISCWWSLMNGLTLSVLAPLVMLFSFRGANWTHTHAHWHTHTLGRCVFQPVKIWRSWARPAPEFINLHLKDNSVTSHMCFDCWILSHYWDLAQGGGQFNNTCRWPVVFLHFYYLSLILASSGNAELMLHSQDAASCVTYCKSQLCKWSHACNYTG